MAEQWGFDILQARAGDKSVAATSSDSSNVFGTRKLASLFEIEFSEAERFVYPTRFVSYPKNIGDLRSFVINVSAKNERKLTYVKQRITNMFLNAICFFIRLEQPSDLTAGFKLTFFNAQCACCS
jgi:O-acetylhomoserine/O-acetylserine sulfhydrylase-like pyridoxal-dependent enzyme